MHLLRVLLLFIAVLSTVCEGAPTKAEPASPGKEPAASVPVIKIPKAAVSTPLFIQGAGGVNMLANVTVTATASPTPTKPDAPGVVAFVPPLGPAGMAVLNAVSKYLVSVHHGWPAGHRIEITFSVPIAPDDTAAAGLAVATVLDSLFAGWESDPTCAVVGHLQADGKVVGVSAAFARLLAAMNAGASRLLIPESNVAEAAVDCLVNEGAGAFGRVQMFAVKDFEEIPMMAGTKLEPEVAESIAAFKEPQAALAAAGPGAAALLKSADTQESLRTVLEKWPNHVSARLLLGSSIGRYQSFSLGGSVQVIERTAAALLNAVNSPQPADVKKLPRDRIDAELAATRLLTERLDSKARGLADRVIAYAEAARTWYDQPPRTPQEATTLGKTLSTEAAQVKAERLKLARALIR